MSPVSRPSSRIIERINPNLINRGDKTGQTRKHDHDDPDYEDSDGDDIGDHYDARDKKKDKRMSRSPGKPFFLASKARFSTCSQNSYLDRHFRPHLPRSS